MSSPPPESTQSPVSLDDPYTWLEEVESEKSLDFARHANDKCLEALGDPSKSNTYDRVLAVLESDDRIPHVSKYGEDMEGNHVLYNFWKDAKNPKGLWRKTTWQDYTNSDEKASINWQTVVDVDKLAKEDGITWVWKGTSALPRARDAESPRNGKVVTRAMLKLSRGGSDATVWKEFDLLAGAFVTDEPFYIPEAKTNAHYRSRNVLSIGTDMGEGSMTDSGYPRQVREWVRGTELKDAPVVFEGEATDVSVGDYISDERPHGGGIYEIRYRSLTFYTSKYWIRKVEAQHLLAPNDEARKGVAEPEEFVELGIQEDADFNLLGHMLMITLRSDWTPIPDGTTYKQGSVIYTETDKFIKEGKEKCEYSILFEPTERTALEYFSVTKNYLILMTMDNVKSKMDFYKINEGRSLEKMGTETPAQIRDVSMRAVDIYEDDQVWFTTSSYLQPSTLYLGDIKQIAEGNDDFVTAKLKSLPAQYDSSDLEMEQRFATSKDGTKVPYFIIKKKGTEMNGKTPTLVYGYGGFEISLGPRYLATTGISWLENGGAYVDANIRGGGEFGPGWHQAALKEKRNKAFEDFIAVGEDLVESGLCRPGTMAARGGSNGGLLMGNMFIMRPDLWGAIHCAVPLLDMKRFNSLLAGASWMAEYGNPDTEDWEKFLYKYSPYHNIDKDANYPPMLVTTSTRDDRVHPAHARKMVKRLWDTNSDWPIYYYENIEGGHGGAADAKQSAFMHTLAYDFMFKTLKENAEK